MSEEQNHPRIHLCDGIAKISADRIYIEPRPTFTKDAIEQIRAIVREEVAAANAERPEPKVTVSFTDDLVAKIARQVALHVAHLPAQPRRR